MTDYIKLVRDDDGIATLSIDVHDRPMNVINATLIAELEQRVREITVDDDIRGVIVTSAKADFMAGADLKWVLGKLESSMSPTEALAFARPLSEVLRLLETCGKPVCAAINGTALGGGLELALACHHRIIVDDPKAVVGLPEVQVGLMPGAGGTQRLPRLIGIREALPLMLEGRHVTPEKAQALGIVDAVVSAGHLLARARQWLLESPAAVPPWDVKGFRVPGGAGAMHPGAVQTFMAGTALTAKATNRNYPAPIAILSAVYEGTIVPFDTGLAIELRYFASLAATPVARNMVRTLFVNKGEADKLVRRPPAEPPAKVAKLGILGAGMMGAGIAYVSARAGMEVVLLDTEQSSAEKGKGYSAKLVARGIERGRISTDKGEALLARITPTTDYALLAGCDLVIEAVFEDRDIKAEVTARAEAVIPPAAIFASNTSTLPITGLAEASGRPAQFIGIHFFSPVDKMPLVEVIVGQQTGEAALARALDYVRQLRKTPIVVNDSRGFFTSRVFATFTNEGMTMLLDGVKPALIENAARLAGMPVGPLAVLDEVSLQLVQHVDRQTAADLGDAYEPPSGRPVFERMVALQRQGKRFGKGFYDYPEDAKKHLWPGLAEAFVPAATQPDVEGLITRLLYRQAIEAARCLEEGVIMHPEDGDIGGILGIGFPPWTGGPFSYIDTLGIDSFVAGCEQLAERHGPRFAPSDWLRARAAAGKTFY